MFCCFFCFFFGGGGGLAAAVCYKKASCWWISSLLDRQRGSETEGKEKEERGEGSGVVSERNERAKAEERCVQKTD